MSPNELERAIQDVFDGVADPETARTLAERLKSDPAARESYYEHAELHEALGTRFSQSSAVETATLLSNSRLRMQMRRSAMAAILSAAALILLSAVILSLVLVSGSDPLGSFETATGSRISVSGSGMEDNELDEGAVVRLEQGSVQLTFNHRSRALILAPATFSFTSRDTLRLYQGTGWFRIEESDRGFMVVTPKLEVTDLGTEFGIVSNPERADQVHVFKGRVLAKGLDTTLAGEELGAGESRATDPPGGLVDIPNRPWDFLVRLPESASDGIVVNGGFESGEMPPDATFGVYANPSYLPGWRFGDAIAVVRANSKGTPGYGTDGRTVLSSTADTQVGFKSNTPRRPPPETSSIYQTFDTIPGQPYEVRFEMGGIFFSTTALSVTASVRDGAGSAGALLADHVETRTPADGNGYNPPASFRFTARSGTTTLVFTETSESTRRADPVIDNISIEKFR